MWVAACLAVMAGCGAQYSRPGLYDERTVVLDRKHVVHAYPEASDPWSRCTVGSHAEWIERSLCVVEVRCVADEPKAVQP